MNNVLNRIKKVRKEKGYSHEYIANELRISQVAYSKLEKNETKLTLERLYKITEILEVSIHDLIDEASKNVFHQDLRDQTIGYQDVGNLYHENKEKTEQIIALYEAALKTKTSLLRNSKSNALHFLHALHLPEHIQIKRINI